MNINKQIYNLIKKIFSIENSANKTHKVVIILGIRCKFRKKTKYFGKRYKIENIGKNNKIYFLNGDNTKESMGCYSPFPIKIIGDNNLCIIPKNVNWLNSEIIIKSNNSTFVMKNTYPNSIVNFYIEINHGNNQEILIGENFTMGGGTMYALEKNSKIKIGKNCMFSTDICLMSSDGHTIRDKESKNVINFADQIIIGDNVWLGKYAKVVKNSSIPANSVVGINSLVNKNFEIPNVILAGIPAKVVKENIEWERTDVSFYKE